MLLDGLSPLQSSEERRGQIYSFTPDHITNEQKQSVDSLESVFMFRNFSLPITLTNIIFFTGKAPHVLIYIFQNAHIKCESCGHVSVSKKVTQWHMSCRCVIVHD